MINYKYISMKSLCILAIIVCLLIGGHNQDPLTASDVHSLKKLSGSVLNPSGQYAVYAVKQWNKEIGKSTQHLQYTNIATKETKDLTTPTEGISDSGPSFSTAFPDSVLFKRVANGKGGIYFLPLPSEKLQPILVAEYPVEIIDFKVGGLTLVFSANVYFECDTLQCSADKIKIEKAATWQGYDNLLMFHWDEWLPQGKGNHIFKQDLEKDGVMIKVKGDPIDITKGMEINSPPLLTDNSNYDVSRDGTQIAFTGHIRNREEAFSTSYRTYYYNIDTGSPVLITGHTNAMTQMPKFSKDGTKIAYLAMKTPMLESENLHLEIYHILTNFIQILDDELDLSITNYVWNNDDSLFFSSTIEGIEKIYKAIVKNKQKAKYIPWTTAVDPAYSYSVPIFGLFSREKGVTVKSGFDLPDELVTFNTHTEEPVTQLNYETLKKFEMVKAESFMFKGGYGDDVQGWLMKPIQFEAGKKYPVAFLIHGGPESSWTTGFSYRWNPELWANRGYVVIMINPHGSTGRGTKFREAVRNDWGGVPYRDLMDGLQHVISKYDFIDNGRMCACGGSYGGYMVNWIQGHDHPFKCLINHDGGFSLLSKFYSTDAIWFQKAEYCPKDKIDCAPFDSSEIRAGIEKDSPERFVNNWKTPMLVIHGGMDYRVPLTEALSTFTALQLKKIESKILYFPLENHWVLKPENSMKWYEEVLNWMDHYTEKK